MEVVEHVLLVRSLTGLMPCLTVLETTPQPGDRVETPGCAPGSDRGRPDRGLGDREPAVAVQDRRGSIVGLDIAAMHEKHADSGAIRRRDTRCARP